MMKQMLQRGFTLIELLVVIAIIGILAAVVLASLNDARDSGNDASIKQSLNNARSQAEIIYNRNSQFTYDGVCEDAQIIQLLDSAVANGLDADGSVAYDDGTASGPTVAVCADSPAAWAISIPLASTGSNSWCVDSTGMATQTANTIDSDAPDFLCGT